MAKRCPMDAAFDVRSNENDGAGWGVYMPTEDEVHVIPEFGPPHIDVRACWCHPEVEEVGDGFLLLHRVAH